MVLISLWNIFIGNMILQSEAKYIQAVYISYSCNHGTWNVWLEDCIGGQQELKVLLKYLVIFDSKNRNKDYKNIFKYIGAKVMSLCLAQREQIKR